MTKKQKDIFSKIQCVEKNYTLYSALCTLIILFTLVSCGQDEECRFPLHAPLRIGFYEMVTDNLTGITTAVNVTIDSVDVRGIGGTTINRFLSARIISVPLNKLDTVSEFIFVFHDSTRLETRFMSDTVRIFHETHEDFLSFECGILTTFTIDSIRTTTTNNYIESIVINSTEVNTFNNAQHIQIFRRTW